jgi:hypothetical protein
MAMSGAEDNGKHQTELVFEKAWQQQEFSELIRLALLLAEWIGRPLRLRRAIALAEHPDNREEATRPLRPIEG